MARDGGTKISQVRYFCSYNANYMNEGLFTFLFDCDAKRKVNRKEKHANYCAAYGIAPRTGYKYKVFIRFCPYGQKSIRRLKLRRL